MQLQQLDDVTCFKLLWCARFLWQAAAVEAAWHTSSCVKLRHQGSEY